MKKYIHALVTVLFFSFLFWFIPSYFQHSEGFQNFKAQIRDVFFKVRHIASSTPDIAKNVVIVTIDEESCEKLESRWPWPRKIFSGLIDQLHESGAKVVGLNVSFTGLENGDESSTRELAAAMARHGNVVVGATFDKGGHLIKPSPILVPATKYGYLEKIVDNDLFIRRSYLLRPYEVKGAGSSEGSFESSFPLQLFLAADGPDDKKPRFDRDLGLLTAGTPTRAVNLGDDGSYTINYLVSENDFFKIPAWKIVERKFEPGSLRGKAVLVGLTSSLFADTHPTPFGNMSGIGIHANEFLALLTGRQLFFVPDSITLFVSWILSLAVLFLFLFRKSWLGFTAFALMLFLFLVGVQMAFARDIVAEPFIPIFALFLSMLVGAVSDSLKLLWENKGLQSKVIQDKMTGLYTYEYLRMRLEDEWKRCHKAKIPITLVMTDLDRFKKINDTLGHEVGNAMIKRTAAVIKESARGYDVVSRYGGDEFVILLWNASAKEAQVYRDRLRSMYHEMAKKLEPELHDSSISIGVASFDPAVDPDTPKDTQALIEQADKDLFIDKESRRKGSGR